MCLGGELEQRFVERTDFRGTTMRGGKGRVFVVQGQAAQFFAAVGVRRTTIRIVPRRVAAVADFRRGLVPGPAFTSVCIHRFKLKQATFDQMWRTCCCPAPQTSFTS